MTDNPLRIGVAGLGTVGASLLAFLGQRPQFAPGGRPINVAAVSARSQNKKRMVDVAAMRWFDDPVALAADPDVDVFVELIGGSEGVARLSVETALERGKPVVTANKALIAHHGAALAARAEAQGVPLLFEAAVMGGTPAVKMLREAMVGDEVRQVSGILNGTCNFILSEMESSGRDFPTVLAEAQSLGYAEADPSMDVGGLDAAHKITILAALAFGCAPSLAAAEVEGVAEVGLLDIQMARQLGYRIKLIAAAVRTSQGVSVRVHPALVPLDHPLAQAGGALNALHIVGERIGRIFIQGPGAGGGPTAAAVAADIADILTGARRPVFQAPATTLTPFSPFDAAHTMGRGYVRLMVRDEPGVIAAISETLAEAKVSIDSFLQKPVEGAGGVPIVLTTHPAPESVLAAAVAAMSKLPSLLALPRFIRLAQA